METIKKPIEASKALEIFNFKTLLLDDPGLLIGKEPISGENGKKKMLSNKVSPITRNVTGESQFTQFQRAMRVLVVCGQLIGINPVLGILEQDTSKIRFTIFSVRFLYSTVIGIAQGIGTVLSLYKLMNESISIPGLAYISFYLTTSCTTFIFQRIAMKWPQLMKELSRSRLREYIDPNIKFKCNIACAIFLTCSLLEHVLSIQVAVVAILDCSSNDINFYEKYITMSFQWLYQLGCPYYLPVGVMLQFLNITSTINWNFLDLFVICMSMYLTSIFEKINKKIELARDNKYLPSSFWRSLREDYNQATRLVHSFDDVISVAILTSFASNLFFICLQLFNFLSLITISGSNNTDDIKTFRNGIRPRMVSLEQCPYHPSGPFRGYEYLVYLVFSLSYLLGRSLAVSLIAANVNSASKAPAQVLYNIPPSMYCEEVQRFLDQIHGNTVALSGLQFFYVTREIVLSVAGTIVTYELVLLQFSADEMKHK